MAHVYVRSLAGGAGTGADWANAYTTLAAACTAKAAGDNFWVSEDHAETQASAMTVTSPGASATPCTIICVDHAGTVPPVSADLRTTAIITTTGNNAMTLAGNAYCQGIAFNCGSTTGAALFTIANTGGQDWLFKNCALANKGPGSNGNVMKLGGGGAGSVILDNTTLEVGNVANQIGLTGSRLIWKNTPNAIAGTPPTSGLFTSAGIQQQVLIEGVDLSAIASTKTIFLAPTVGKQITLKNCKLASGVVVSGTPTSIFAGPVDVVMCDSGATNYRTERYAYQGTQTVEATIVRTGGATDGTTPISWKIVTTANSKWIAPFESIPMAIWNDVTAANVTVTVYGVWGGGAVPNNDEIWMEVSYMGSSATPIATINTANTKADYLAAAAAQGTDGSTWGGSTTAFKMAVTLSSPQPGMKGPIYVTVKAAKASSTFYVDPKIVLS
jgi:hypothetical protein